MVGFHEKPKTSSSGSSSRSLVEHSSTYLGKRSDLTGLKEGFKEGFEEGFKEGFKEGFRFLSVEFNSDQINSCLHPFPMIFS